MLALLRAAWLPRQIVRAFAASNDGRWIDSRCSPPLIGASRCTLRRTACSPGASPSIEGLVITLQGLVRR